MRGCAPLFFNCNNCNNCNARGSPAVSPHLPSRQATMAFAAASASCRTGRATSKVEAGNVGVFVRSAQ